MKKNNGVYMLKCKSSGNFYIGSAKDITNHRWSNHKDKIKNEEHNRKINKEIELYGSDDDVWEYSIIEYCHLYQLNDREDYYITLLKPNLNVRKKASRPKLTYYKNKQRKQKMSVAQSGSNNPRHKGLLLDDDVLKIKMLLALGMTNTEVHELFKDKCSYETIGKIKANYRYKHVKLEDHIVSDWVRS